MPTHGNARNETVRALTNRKPFTRPGFAMTATERAPGLTGAMPEDTAKQYQTDRQAPGIAYAVLSYRTPIAWVRNDGKVIVPDVRYSVTTSNHQSLCRTYL